MKNCWEPGKQLRITYKITQTCYVCIYEWYLYKVIQGTNQHSFYKAKSQLSNCCKFLKDLMKQTKRELGARIHLHIWRALYTKLLRRIGATKVGERSARFQNAWSGRKKEVWLERSRKKVKHWGSLRLHPPAVIVLCYLSGVRLRCGVPILCNATHLFKLGNIREDCWGLHENVIGLGNKMSD